MYDIFTAALDPDRYEHLALQPVANAGIHTEPMWNETRRILQDFYRPWNIRLEQILDIGPFNWGY